jgi:hypothetical protein
MQMLTGWTSHMRHWRCRCCLIRHMFQACARSGRGPQGSDHMGAVVAHRSSSTAQTLVHDLLSDPKTDVPAHTNKVQGVLFTL